MAIRKKVSVRLDDKYRHRLDDIARNQGTNRSEVIRQLIVDATDEKQNKK